jgi:hypothetical protein
MQDSNLSSKPPKQQKLTKAAADSIAIEALGFLAEDPSRLKSFLTLSGLRLETLRAAAHEPGFLAAVLDYLASDEALLLAFAGRSGRDPAALANAREILSPPAKASPLTEYHGPIEGA